MLFRSRQAPFRRRICRIAFFSPVVLARPQTLRASRPSASPQTDTLRPFAHSADTVPTHAPHFGHGHNAHGAIRTWP